MVWLAGAAYCGLAIGVHLLWRRPSMEQFMLKHFTVSVENMVQRRRYTLLSSAFAHKHPLHLGLNCVAGYSFGNRLDDKAFRHLREPGQPLSLDARLIGYLGVPLLFCSAAVVSGAGSVLYKIAIKSAVPSVGASGGVFSLMWASLGISPNERHAFIFLPSYSFPGQYSGLALAGFDLMGAALRWQLIDHVAHLTGAGFGLLVAKGLLRSLPKRPPPAKQIPPPPAKQIPPPPAKQIPALPTQPQQRRS